MIEIGNNKLNFEGWRSEDRGKGFLCCRTAHNHKFDWLGSFASL